MLTSISQCGSRSVHFVFCILSLHLATTTSWYLCKWTWSSAKLADAHRKLDILFWKVSNYNKAFARATFMDVIMKLEVLILYTENNYWIKLATASKSLCIN